MSVSIQFKIQDSLKLLYKILIVKMRKIASLYDQMNIISCQTVPANTARIKY